MVEFASILFLKRHVGKNLKEAKKEKKKGQEGQGPNRSGSKENHWKVQEEKTVVKKREKGFFPEKWSLTALIKDVDVFCYKVDHWSFMVFAVVFVIFNIVFFNAYPWNTSLE